MGEGSLGIAAGLRRQRSPPGAQLEQARPTRRLRLRSQRARLRRCCFLCLIGLCGAAHA